jgi:hypothetical protein
MADGFFHLSYGYGEITQNGCRLARALAAARQSTCAPVSERWYNEFSARGNPLREAWLAVLTKFGLLEVVAKRLDRNLALLHDDLARNDDKAHDCAAAPDSSYPTEDARLSIELVESMEAFIIQHRSAYEMVGEFVRQFCVVMLDQPAPWHKPKVMEEIAFAAGRNPAWIYTLKKARDHFAHEKSGWIGVRITDGATPEVFIMKSDLTTLAKPDDFIAVPQLQEIYHGFSRGVEDCVDWLVAKIQEIEAGTP